MALLPLALLAFLPLLTLTLLPLLALLTLTLLPLLALLTGLVQAPVHGLHATHEVARVVERVFQWICLTLARRALRSLQLVPERL